MESNADNLFLEWTPCSCDREKNDCVFEVWDKISMRRRGTVQIVWVGIYFSFWVPRVTAIELKIGLLQERFHASFVLLLFFTLLFLACRWRLCATKIHKWLFIIDVRVKSVHFWTCIFCKSIMRQHLHSSLERIQENVLGSQIALNTFWKLREVGLAPTHFPLPLAGKAGDLWASVP